MGLKEWLRRSFHFIAFMHYAVTTIYLLMFVDYSKSNHQSVQNIRNFMFRYLTSWNLSVQSTLFTLCLVNDFLGKYRDDVVENPKLASCARKLGWLKGIYFGGLAFPSAWMVSLMFWSLYLYDRDLVFPAAMDAVISPLLNHSMHTVIVVLVTIELLVCRQKYTHRWISVALSLIYINCSAMCIIGTYLQYGQWLYPIFDSMNWFQLLMFTIFCNFCMVVLYFIGEKVASILPYGGSEAEQTAGKSLPY